MAMPTWVRAVILMPMIAISSITKMTAVAIRMFGQVLVAESLKMASTDGARITTPET